MEYRWKYTFREQGEIPESVKAPLVTIVERHFGEEADEVKIDTYSVLLPIALSEKVETTARALGKKASKASTHLEKAAKVLENDPQVKLRATLARKLPPITAFAWRKKWQDALLVYLIDGLGWSKKKAASKADDVLADLYEAFGFPDAPFSETLRSRLKGESLPAQFQYGSIAPKQR